jgi:flagellar basal-body rod protein FlgB
MDPTRIGLFDLAEKRLTWAAQRQSVLAANIANANTPGYQARDIVSFDQTLAGATIMQPAQTEFGHLAGTLPTGPARLRKDPTQPRSLDGNTVALDKQLTMVADAETSQSLVTTIWKKYVAMFNTALDRSG